MPSDQAFGARGERKVHVGDFGVARTSRRFPHYLLTTCLLPITSDLLPPTTYHLPPTTYHLPPTTYHLPRCTWDSSGTNGAVGHGAGAAGVRGRQRHLWVPSPPRMRTTAAVGGC